LCTCAPVSCESLVLLTSLSRPHSTLFPHTSYIPNGFYRGVCVFPHRQMSEHGQRGFRLSSLGILLACSVRPRPWRHVFALRALAHEIYGSPDEHPRGSVGEPQGDDWAPARRFFNERRVRRTDLGGTGEWCHRTRDLMITMACVFLSHPA
jgi:hypothetical protein